MKKNVMTGSPEIKKPLKDAPVTSPKKIGREVQIQASLRNMKNS
jgi:hypothetical protein